MDNFLEEVKETSGVDVGICLQCGTCTGGCVQEPFMDYNSRMINSMIINGERENVLRSKAIWMCSSCFTCSARCPREIDLAKVMNTLRHISKREGLVHPKAKVVPLFCDLFLGLVKRYGRSFEPGLLFGHNIFSGRLIKDAEKAPRLIRAGKINFLPHKIEQVEEIKQIFERVKAMEEEHV